MPDYPLDTTTDTPQQDTGAQQPESTPPANSPEVAQSTPEVAHNSPDVAQSNAPAAATPSAAPAPAPTHTWDEIAGSDDFKKLPKPDQMTVLSNYANEVGNHLRSLPGADANQVDADLKQFTDSKINDIYPPTGFLKTVGIKLGQGMADTASGVLSWIANSIDNPNKPEEKGWLNGFAKALMPGVDATQSENLKKLTGTFRDMAKLISESKEDIHGENQYGPDWFKWKFGTEAQQAFAKNLPQSESGAGQVAAGVIGPLLYGSFGLPALIVQHRFQSYGENYERTNDPTQAMHAANLATVGDLLFVGQGHGIIAGLNKILPKGMPAITKWATKVAAGTAGNITTGQLLSAADAALNDQTGDPGKAFRDRFMELGVTDAGVQTAFALLGAGSPFARTQRIADAHGKLQADIAEASKMEAAGLPKSAAEQRAAAQAKFEAAVSAIDTHIESVATPLSRVRDIQEKGVQQAPTDALKDLAANPNIAKPLRERVEGELARRAEEGGGVRKQPAPIAAEVASTPATPHDFVPALRDSEGTHYEGEKGTDHANIYAAKPEVMIAAGEPEHGFIDTRTGEFKSRDETAKLLGEPAGADIPEASKFSAQRLRELQESTPEGGDLNGNKTRQSNNSNQTSTETSTNAQTQGVLTPEAGALRRQVAEPPPVRDTSDAYQQATSEGVGGKENPEIAEKVTLAFKTANKILGERGANTLARDHIYELLQKDLLKNKEDTGDPFKTKTKEGEIVDYSATKRLSTKLQDYLDLHENSRRGTLPEREKPLDYDPEDVTPKTGKQPGAELEFAGETTKPVDTTGVELSPAERIERAEAAVKEGEHPYAAQVRGAISRHFAAFARDPEVPRTAAPEASKDQVTRAAKIVYDQILEKATGKKLEIGESASAAGKPGPVQKLVADEAFRAAVEEKVAGRIRQDIRATIPKERLQHLEAAGHENAFRLMGVENTPAHRVAIQHAIDLMKRGRIPLKTIIDALPEAIKTRVREVEQRFNTSGGIKGALQSIVDTAPNTQEGRLQKVLAQALIERSSDSPVVVDPTLINREGATGTYDRNSEEIRMAPVTSENKMRGTLLHEATHPILETKIEAFKQGRTDLISESDHGALTSLEALMKRAQGDERFKTNPNDRLFYGLSDLHEFVTEILSNRDFQEFLHSLPAEQIPGSKSFGKTVFDQVKQLLRTLVLGDKPVGEGSVLAQAFDNTIDLIKSGRLEDQIASRFGTEKVNTGPISKKAMEDGYVHINLRGNTLDLSRPVKGWVLPTFGGSKFNTSGHNYARAGLQAVFVPKEWVESKGGRPARIKEGFIPSESQIATIDPSHVRENGTVDWPSVFNAERFGKRLETAGVTSTPEFKKWFGDSKVVDENGEPLVVYHGTPREEVNFISPSKAMEVRDAAFFSDNQDMSHEYTRPREYGEPVYEDAEGNEIPSGIVVPSYLSIKNPLRVDFDGAVGDAVRFTEMVKQAKEQGNDGIIATNVADGLAGSGNVGTTYAIFDSNQVKHATENSGAFSTTDNNIRKQPAFDAEKLEIRRKQQFMDDFAAEHGFKTADDMAAIDPALYNEGVQLHEGQNTKIDFNRPDLRFAMAEKDTRTETTKRAERLFSKLDKLGVDKKSEDIVQEVLETHNVPTASDFAEAFQKAGFKPAVAEAAGNAMEAHFQLATFEKAEAQATVANNGAEKRAARDQKPISENASEDGKNPTSLKNAIVDEERVKRGLPPAMQAARKTFGETWDRAMNIVNSDPGRGADLVEDLNTKARPLSDEENAILLHRQVTLQNEYNGAVDAINKAAEAGDTLNLEENRVKMARLADSLLDVYNAGKAAGTENARGLAIRKMLVKEDYSLGAMLSREQASRGVDSLSDEVKTEIRDLHQKLFDAHEKLVEVQSRQDETQSVATGEAAVADVVTRVGGGEATGKNGRARVVKPRDPKEELTLDEQRDRIMKGMQKALAKKGDLNDVQPWVKKLAENFVRRGLDKLQPLSRALHETVKVIIPDITERQVRDMFSGYGDFKQLDHDAIKTKVRDLKGLLQQAGKIGDMIAGEAPKKTGAERRTPSDHERELIKLVNDIKKEGGFSVTDPAKQLKTALDSVKTRLKNQIKDMTRQIETGVRPAEKSKLEYDQEAETLRALRDRVQETLNEIVEKPDLSEEQRVKIAKKALEKSIEEYNRRLENDDYSRREKKTPVSTPEIEALRAQRDALREEYKTFEALEHPERRQEALLQAYKTRIASRIAELQQRIAENNFAPKPKRSSALELDSEALKVQADYERVRGEYEMRLTKNQLANRTTFEKGTDFLANYGRAVKLTAISTLGKLAAAAAHRMVTTPIEEAIGAGIGSIPGVSKVFKKANLEGGFNIQAEARAFTKAMTAGMKDAYDMFRSGETDLTLNFEKKRNVPRSVLDFFGELHGAMKAPTKRAAFERAMEKGVAAALRDGVDISNPLVKTQLMADAYKQANRAIFMNDNRVVQAYRQAISALERPDKVTGKPTFGGKTAATVAKVLLPIVKVPTNYVSEAFVHAFGTVTGSVRLARALAKGIDNLHPDEANLIARHLKKGSLGAAVLLMGYFNSAPGVIQGGGYYQSGEKRKEGDLEASELKVFGHSLPKFLAHTPLIEVFQMGRTIRRVADSYVSASDREKKGITAGLWAGGLGLAEETPFLDTVFQSKKIAESPEDYFGNLARGIVVPGAVSNVAQWTDRENGKAVKRKAKTFLQQIELGIPGLRQQVPRKPHQ